MYQRRDSLVIKHPWTAGQEQPQEELQGHIDQLQSTSHLNELHNKQAHRSWYHSPSKLDTTRNDHPAHLQQQPAQQYVVPRANFQRTSRKRFNMRDRVGLQNHTNLCQIFNTPAL